MNSSSPGYPVKYIISIFYLVLMNFSYPYAFTHATRVLYNSTSYLFKQYSHCIVSLSYNTKERTHSKHKFMLQCLYSEFYLYILFLNILIPLIIHLTHVFVRIKIKERRFMKTSELRKILKKHGCTLSCHGKRHNLWYSPITGKIFPVPRHSSKEIPTGTYESIRKDAGF